MTHPLTQRAYQPDLITDERSGTVALYWPDGGDEAWYRCDSSLLCEVKA